MNLRVLELEVIKAHVSPRLRDVRHDLRVGDPEAFGLHEAAQAGKLDGLWAFEPVFERGVHARLCVVQMHCHIESQLSLLMGSSQAHDR